MTRAALYARVSTFDQDPQMQLDELRELARQRGWTATEYVDHGVSGVRMKRPALGRLLEDARRGKLDLVVVWKLDRLGRSMIDLANLLACLEKWQVGFLSLRDLGIDTTTPLGRLLMQLVAAFAQFERDLIRERTCAGLARARALGKVLGRPRSALSGEDVEAAVQEYGSVRRAAEAIGVARATLYDRINGGVRKTSLQSSSEVQEQPAPESPV